MGKYTSSPQWSDITPIPLIDDLANLDPSDPNPIQPLATIAYAPAYSEAMSYLRAVMATNEFSPRALSLTADVISMNPAHYTVWLYRVKILKELKMDVLEELKWLEGVARRNLKNYQIWHHRQTIMTTLSALPPSEPSFITSILSLDTKNYHVWTYRQWLCTRFPDALLNHPDELARIETMIDEDVRNNSAWNHRWFLAFGAQDLKDAGDRGIGSLRGFQEGKGGVVDEDLVEREIAYAQAKIRLAPQNPSPWNYLRGVLRRAGRPLSSVKDFCLEFVGEDGDVEFSADEIEDGTGGVRSSHAVEWLGEIWGADGRTQLAAGCWDVLARKWDPVRKGYWEYRRQKLEEQAKADKEAPWEGVPFGVRDGARFALGTQGG